MVHGSMHGCGRKRKHNETTSLICSRPRIRNESGFSQFVRKQKTRNLQICKFAVAAADQINATVSTAWANNTCSIDPRSTANAHYSPTRAPKDTPASQRCVDPRSSFGFSFLFCSIRAVCSFLQNHPNTRTHRNK